MLASPALQGSRPLNVARAKGLHNVYRWFGDHDWNVVPRVDVNVRNAAKGVWVTCLLAVALEPFEAHGILRPAVGLSQWGGVTAALIVASREAALSFCVKSRSSSLKRVQQTGMRDVLS
jgi:hypothetical protein